MFNVSFNVNDDKLTTALTALQPLLKEWGGNSLQASPLDENAIVNAEAALNTPNTTRSKRKYKKREPKPLGISFGTQRDRAALVISQIGNQPFDIKDVKRHARRLGVGETALYQVLQRERDAGRMVRLSYGKWQRTAPNGWFNSEAVNQ